MTPAAYRKETRMTEKQACERCLKVGDDVTRRRQNTQYVNDESNFCILCHDCQQEADEHWSDMWADYYSGIM